MWKIYKCEKYAENGADETERSFFFLAFSSDQLDHNNARFVAHVVVVVNPWPGCRVSEMIYEPSFGFYRSV